jgi:hypothetical protein
MGCRASDDGIASVITYWSSAHILRNMLCVRKNNVATKLFVEENVTRVLCCVIFLIWKITKEHNQMRKYCYAVPTFANLFSLNKSDLLQVLNCSSGSHCASGMYSTYGESCMKHFAASRSSIRRKIPAGHSDVLEIRQSSSILKLSSVVK